MNKHHGKILKEIVKMKGIEDDWLALLLKSNKTSITRLFQSVNINWDTLAIIARLIGHDLSGDYPDISQSARQNYYDSHMQKSDYVDDFSNVFLVDDSETDIFIFKKSLQKANKNVSLRTFNNGDEAINKLLEISINRPEHLPEHLFLDLKMPVMDGASFLEHYHRLNIDPYGKVKIHVLTSSVFYSELNRFTVHPLVDSCLSKPIKPDIIATII